MNTSHPSVWLILHVNHVLFHLPKCNCQLIYHFIMVAITSPSLLVAIHCCPYMQIILVMHVRMTLKITNIHKMYSIFSKALLLSHLKTYVCMTYIQMWVIWIMSTCLDDNKNSLTGSQMLLLIQNLTHSISLRMRPNRKCTHACIHNGSISLIDVLYC